MARKNETPVLARYRYYRYFRFLPRSVFWKIIPILSRSTFCPFLWKREDDDGGIYVGTSRRRWRERRQLKRENNPESASSRKRDVSSSSEPTGCTLCAVLCASFCCRVRKISLVSRRVRGEENRSKYHTYSKFSNEEMLQIINALRKLKCTEER